MDKNGQSYRLSLKEFRIATSVAALFIVSACVITYFMGYNRNPEDIALIFGFPDWIFFGVLIPWVTIVAFTVIYSLFFMKGDDET